MRARVRVCSHLLCLGCEFELLVLAELDQHNVVIDIVTTRTLLSQHRLNAVRLALRTGTQTQQPARDRRVHTSDVHACSRTRHRAPIQLICSFPVWHEPPR